MRAVGYTRCLLCSGIALLALGAGASPCLALEPGVHADPGSPAEKEYVLPLNQARGTGGEASSGSSSPHLFGAGIKPPRGGGSAGGGSQPGGGEGTGQGKAGTRHSGASAKGSGTGRVPVPGGAGGQSAPLPDAVLRASHAQGSSGNGSLLALIGGGIAILVVGAFGGTVLRHSRRETPSSGRPTATS